MIENKTNNLATFTVNLTSTRDQHEKKRAAPDQSFEIFSPQHLEVGS